VFWRCYFDADERWHCVDLFVTNISQASSLIYAEKLSSKHKVLPRVFPTHASCFYNYRICLLWHRDKEQQLSYLLLFSLTCAGLISPGASFTTTLLPYFPGPQVLPNVSEELEAWGASLCRFEVKRLKRKDLSTRGDEAKVGRGGRSVWGTGKAVNTEHSGPSGHN